mgnify:CR=1 FL=1
MDEFEKANQFAIDNGYDGVVKHGIFEGVIMYRCFRKHKKKINASICKFVYVIDGVCHFLPFEIAGYAMGYSKPCD